MKNLVLIFALSMSSLVPALARDNSRRDDRKQTRSQSSETRRSSNKPRRQNQTRAQRNRRNDSASRDRRRSPNANRSRNRQTNPTTGRDRSRRRTPTVDNSHNRRRTNDSTINRRRANDSTVNRRRNPRRDYYRHNPYRERRQHNRRWSTPRQYHRTISNYDLFANRWLRIGLALTNGYHWYNDYPFYVYGGYRHRYSSYDSCEYELVDSYTDQIYTTFSYQSCSTGYDVCADSRDDLNYYESDARYFCAESYQL